MKKIILLIAIMAISIGVVAVSKISSRSRSRPAMEITKIETGKMQITPVSAKSGNPDVDSNCCSEGVSKCTRDLATSPPVRNSSCGGKCEG